MIKFFRKIRQSLLHENRFKKYLVYAVGEIILVVIGILIAITINNANQRRLNQESLKGYLQSISHNLESDLKKAKKIYQDRRELLPKVYSLALRMTPEHYEIRSEVYGEDIDAEYIYSVENIDFVSQTINKVWKPMYLTPNLSGFESLKNSGFLSQLQGTDIEVLLFDYYNLLNETVIVENDYNASLNSSFEEFINADLPGIYAFFNPGIQDWYSVYGDNLKGMIDDIIKHPSLIPIRNMPEELIINYENLIVMGEALNKMIQTESFYFTEEIDQELNQLFDKYGDDPYPVVVREGYNSGRYNYSIASANNDQGVNLQFLGSHTTVQFDSMAWAVAYWFVGNGVVDVNRLVDFSEFSSLKLRLRGLKGGEKISIGIKDKSNPTDGSETKIPLTLSDEWEDYIIPLSDFAPTRLDELFIVTAIVVENQACVVEVEGIEYLKEALLE